MRLAFVAVTADRAEIERRARALAGTADELLCVVLREQWYLGSVTETTVASRTFRKVELPGPVSAKDVVYAGLLRDGRMRPLLPSVAIHELRHAEALITEGTSADMDAGIFCGLSSASPHALWRTTGGRPFEAGELERLAHEHAMGFYFDAWERNMTDGLSLTGSKYTRRLSPLGIQFCFWVLRNEDNDLLSPSCLEPIAYFWRSFRQDMESRGRFVETPTSGPPRKAVLTEIGRAWMAALPPEFEDTDFVERYGRWGAMERRAVMEEINAFVMATFEKRVIAERARGTP